MWLNLASKQWLGYEKVHISIYLVNNGHYCVYQKLEGDEKVSVLDANLSQKRHELLTLRDKNKEHKLEIEDYKRKICQRFVPYKYNITQHFFI